MSAHARPALPAIALCASFALSLLSPNNATAAPACLTAPNGVAPQGSHWFYRLEHPSLRKCWRLVRTEGKGQSVAARAAPAPQDDDAVAQPAPSAPAARAATAASEATERPAEPQAVAPAPVIKTLVTRNVSNSENNAAPAPLLSDPPANTVPRNEVPSAPAPVEQIVSKEPARAAIVEPLVPAPATVPAHTSVAAPSAGPTLRTLLGALALLGIFASAIFFVLQMRQRRSDVLNTAWDAGAPPFVAAPEAPHAPDAPSFAPLPPLGPLIREDNIEQVLRRFAQNLKHSNA